MIDPVQSEKADEDQVDRHREADDPGRNHQKHARRQGSDRQQRILGRLRAAPDACVLYNPALVRSWQPNQKEVEALPLAHYILFDMPKIAARGPYEIRVHPQRKSIWHSIDGS